MPFGGMLTMGLISAGTSIAGGFLGGNKNTNKPLYTDDQKSMQSTVAGDLNTRLKTGGKGYFDPSRVSAIGDVNAGFNGLQDQMQRGLTARGFRSSGKMGKTSESLGIARAGEVGKVNAGYDQMSANFDQNSMQQALQFAFAGPGSQQQQGTPLGNGLNAGMSTLSTLMGLNHMLNSDSGGGFGGGGGGYEPLGTLDQSIATSP